MFFANDLQDLLSFNPESQMVSLYIMMYPHGPQSDNTRLEINQLLKHSALSEDNQVIQDYIKSEYDGKSRSLAVFSCFAKKYFKAIPFDLPIKNHIHTLNRPYLSPLIGYLERYSDWGVILVDRQGARLLTFNMGELIEQEGFMGEAVKQVKRGGGASFHGRMGGSTASSNIDNVIESNISLIVEHVTNFIVSKKIKRIIIGGSTENITLLKVALPKAWQSLLAGTIQISITADHSEIASAAINLIDKISNESENSLVTQAITLAAKGDRGAIGLDDTLNAIHAGQVQTLLVTKDFSEPGFQCVGCSYLTTQEVDKCPFCGSKFSKIPNAVEFSILKAKEKNASIHMIAENDQLLKSGGIAAIMRYS